MHNLSRTDVLLNDFAIRSFRDTADHDYIASRLSFRARLLPQFMWAGLQALEKYLKCILLINRVPLKKPTHELRPLIHLVNANAPFRLDLSPSSIQIIDHLDNFGRFRYLEVPWYVCGIQLPQLDQAVWEIRRYADVINYKLHVPGHPEIDMLEQGLAKIANSNRNPHLFDLSGELEKILKKKDHEARSALIWRNLYFSSRQRNRIPVRHFSASANSPLSLHPEILDEVVKYVFVPHGVLNAYREELKQQAMLSASKKSQPRT